MNLVIFTGRLTRDPKISHYTDGKGEQKQVATYTLAVSRYGGSKEADFPNLKAFGKNADFASNYLKQGVKINATCHVQTGSYTNKDGVKVFTTDFIVDSVEFCESRGGTSTETPQYNEAPQQNMFSPPPAPDNSFMDIPSDVGQDLPFR